MKGLNGDQERIVDTRMTGVQARSSRGIRIVLEGVREKTDAWIDEPRGRQLAQLEGQPPRK